MERGSTPEPTSKPYEVTINANPSGARVRLRIGRLVRMAGRAVIGACAVALGAAGLAVMVLAVVNRPAAKAVATSVIPIFGFALGLGQLLTLAGRDLIAQAEILMGLTVHIDAEGFAWSGPLAGRSTWDGVEHVVFTAGRRGSRRMRLIAAGATNNSRADDPLLFAWVRRVFQPDRFLLDVPIDRFDRSAEQIFQSVKRASAGRFPDSYSTRQFSYGPGDANE